VYVISAITQLGVLVSDDTHQTLLDRVATGIHGLEGLQESSPASPAHFQPAGHAAWVRRQFDADPIMGRDYLQAAARHPHLFRNDTAGIMSHVEAVVRHFAADGLTRQDYFKAVAADPVLLLQKPASVITNVEAVMDHYAADQLMRCDYLQAAVDQPILFRTSPAAVFANIEATVDRLEAQGFTRSDCLSRAVDRPRLFVHGPQPLRARTTPETGPIPLAAPQDTPTAQPPGQVADSSPLPSTCVQNPALYVSYVAGQGRAR
jgi:hypothetical protein